MTKYCLIKKRKKHREYYVLHREETLLKRKKYRAANKFQQDNNDTINCTEERCKNMISSFRTHDLQLLLGKFGRSKTGRKSELMDRALELLHTNLTGFNCQGYRDMIVEIYLGKQKKSISNKSDTNQNMVHDQTQMTSEPTQQRRLYQPIQRVAIQYPEQPIRVSSRLSLPQTMPQMQRGMYGNRNAAGNINFQPTDPGTSMLVNQQLRIRAPDQVGNDGNTSQTSNNCISDDSVANVSFKKLPFFEVINELCKPSVLIGNEKCSLQTFPHGMRESVHQIPLDINQVNFISLNRDLTKNEYPYQVLIRICLLDPGSTEITDFLPLGLNIRIFSRPCTLPPNSPNTRPGTEGRRVPRPINCSHFLKLNPKITNIITFNWVPDGKTYVWGAYLVKQLSSDFLLQKLLSKEARSSDETKNNIIKKLADVDPDLATTSYRFSLICPLGKMRMRIPAKSINCDHLQCFDASIFILMNEKKPTWLCPTCNKACNYDDIQIESYFLDIVTNSSLSDSCQEIEILADGTWRVYVKPEENTSIDNEIHNENPIESVDLDDSDEDESDANSNVPSEEPQTESNNVTIKESSDVMKSSFIDLTLDDDEQENEAQAAGATQPATTIIDLIPQTLGQVQPQQAVTSSVLEGVIEIDSPSSPPGTPPTETLSP